MIFVEIFEYSSRVKNFTSENYNKGTRLSLHLIEEVCDQACINSKALKKISSSLFSVFFNLL